MSTSKPPSVRSDGYYRRFTGDYQRDTKGLSLAEHGAYNQLLDSYYSEEELPADLGTLYRIAGAMDDLERKAVDKVVKKYFTVQGDHLIQERVERELAARRAFLAAQSLRGKIRAGNAKRGPKGRWESADPAIQPAGSPAKAPADDQPRKSSQDEPAKDDQPRESSHASASASASRSGSASPSATSKKTTPRRRGKHPPRAFVLPDHIPGKVWDDFEAMRTRLRKPLTDRGRELIVQELEKIGGDPVPLLEQSIRNDWLDVFPLRDKRGPGVRDRPAAEPKGFAAIRALRVADGRNPDTGEPIDGAEEASK